MPTLAPLVVFLFFALLPPSASAQPGSLDPSFGVGGKLVIAIPKVKELVILPDGKLLFLGRIDGIDSFGIIRSSDVAVYRLQADGLPDSTFGINGQVIIDFDDLSAGNYPHDRGSSIVVLENGKIMIAGTNDHKYTFLPGKILLARLHADGTLDDDFGDAGKMLLDFNDFSPEAKQIRKFTNGDFLLWAALTPDTSSVVSHIALIRFKADGSVDTSFGPDGNGVLVKPTGSASPIIGARSSAFRITPDEKMVLLGRNNDSYYINRYHSDGADDLAFGTSGQVKVNLIQPQVGDMVIQTDGKILTAGHSYYDGDARFTLIRLNTDGSLDTSFSGDGMVFDDLAEYGCIAYDIALQSDGKAVVVGLGEFNAGSLWLVARYKSNGQPDANFGVNGVVKTTFEEVYGTPFDVVIDAQHGIYAAGPAYDSNGGAFWSMAKYLPGIYTKTKDIYALQDNLQAQLSPNPSSPDEAFSLHYQLPAASSVSAQLFNLHGQTVQILFSAEQQTSGEHTRTLEWPAGLAAGFYCLRLQTETTQAILPVVLR